MANTEHVGNGAGPVGGAASPATETAGAAGLAEATGAGGAAEPARTSGVEVAEASEAVGTPETGLAEIGVIGGSGFYSFLDDVTEIQVDTPYGPPSDSLFLGEIAGRRVAFLPRHG